MNIEIKKIIFNNKIVLYWIDPDSYKKGSYRYFLNNKLVATNKVTNFSFANLKSDTTYEVEVKNGTKTIFKQKIKTSKNKNVIDVKKIIKNKRGLLTKDLQKLIDRSKKGDSLYFAKGTYLTGALFLHSDLEIYLDKGAVILGSDKPKDYLPKIKSRFEGTELDCYASLLNVGKLNHRSSFNAHNIIIRGEGEIRGGGNVLQDAIIKEELKHLDKKSVDTSKISYEVAAGRFRNRLINISNTKDVIIDGLTLGSSASWNVHMIYSDNVVTSNCNFISYIPGLRNGDGWDPDSSSNCVIFHCTFDTGDDCIAIKSGKNPEGNLINIPSKHIYVFDCKALRGHGVSIGSELSGGISDVKIYDSDFTNTLYGIHIKTTKKRGGYCKDVQVSNVMTSTIAIHSVPYNDDGKPSKTITKFTNFIFDNVKISGITYLDKDKTDHVPPILIEGFDDYPKSFNKFIFNDFTISKRAKKKNKIINATNIKINQK